MGFLTAAHARALRRRLVRETRLLYYIAIAATLVVCTSGAAQPAHLGTYRCEVQQIHGDDELGRLWADAILTFDADLGLLYGTFAVWGIEPSDSTPRRLFSRLRIVTGPWQNNHLTAVQYDAVGAGNVRPILAWLQLETLDDPDSPRFSFFSNTIRVIAAGTCQR